MMENSVVPDGKSALTVYVVEDDVLARESVIEMLGLRGFVGAGFESAEALLAGGPLRRPACVVLDVGLPGMGGLQLQQRLQREQPGLPIVILTGAADVAVARTALTTGAVDFLLKPVQALELIEAVAVALASDEARVRKLADLAGLQRLVDSLSEREREIFQRITDGMQNREIGTLLGVSIRTVEAHRANLMKKLNAERAADLFHIRARLEAA